MEVNRSDLLSDCASTEHQDTVAKVDKQNCVARFKAVETRDYRTYVQSDEYDTDRFAFKKHYRGLVAEQVSDPNNAADQAWKRWLNAVFGKDRPGVRDARHEAVCRIDNSACTYSRDDECYGKEKAATSQPSAMSSNLVSSGNHASCAEPRPQRVRTSTQLSVASSLPMGKRPLRDLPGARKRKFTGHGPKTPLLATPLSAAAACSRKLSEPHLVELLGRGQEPVDLVKGYIEAWELEPATKSEKWSSIKSNDTQVYNAPSRYAERWMRPRRLVSHPTWAKTIITVLELKTSKKGQAQTPHLDTFAFDALTKGIRIVNINLSPDRNSTLQVGSKVITMRPGEGLDMPGLTVHGGTGDVHESRLYVLYSTIELAESEVELIRMGALDLQFWKIKLPDYEVRRYVFA